jgi:IMP dehydrogenase
MAKLITEPSITFNEVNMIPRRKRTFAPGEVVTLRTPLIKYVKGKESSLYLNIPMSSAIMQSVSGPDLAIALARQGGVSFIFCSQSIESQVEMVRTVKKFKAGFVKSDSNLPPTATLEDAIRLTEKTQHSTIAITESGEANSKLLGILTDKDYWTHKDPLDSKVQEYMTPLDKLIWGTEGITLEEANNILWKSKKGCLPILNKEGRLVSLVFRGDYDSSKDNPLALVDKNKWDYKERVPALIEGGVDVLCFDTSDAFSDDIVNAAHWIRSNFSDILLGGGNIVAADAFDCLSREAGLDFIKVGIGGGSICKTTPTKGIGRGQATAVYDCVQARDKFFEETGIYVPVCSDGGVIMDSQVTKALALGADFVTLGRYFARCEESPNPKENRNGTIMKPYWGEGSIRAQNWQRYSDTPIKKLEVEEGIDGWVPYAGFLKDVVEDTLKNVRFTMRSNLGSLNLDEMHRNAILERRSEDSIREGDPHDIIMNEPVSTYKSKTW